MYKRQTQEVQTEATDHQFFFSALNGLTTVVSYTDKDSNGNPLGILTSLNTGAVSSGKLRITLRPVSYTHLILYKVFEKPQSSS